MNPDFKKRLIEKLGQWEMENYYSAWLEAAGGFEPPNNGFADRRLTTWLSRLS